MGRTGAAYALEVQSLEVVGKVPFPCRRQRRESAWRCDRKWGELQTSRVRIKDDANSFESPIMEGVEHNDLSGWFIHPHTFVIQHCLQGVLEIIDGVKFSEAVEVGAGEAEVSVNVFMRVTGTQVAELTATEPVKCNERGHHA